MDELLIKHYEYLNSNGKLGSLLYLVDYYLSNLNFYRFDISSCIINYCKFDNCVFEQTCIQESKINYTEFTNCTFENVDFSNVNLAQSTFDDCKFKRVDFSDSNFDALEIINSDLSDRCDLRGISTDEFIGYDVISVGFNTSRKNARLSYWKDLGIWTTGCFQGTKDELIEQVTTRYVNTNNKLYTRYIKAIEYIESIY